MSACLPELVETLQQRLPAGELTFCETTQELTFVLPQAQLLENLKTLRLDEGLSFDTLIDLCGVDYLVYGSSEWQTNDATLTGFDRGVETLHEAQAPTWDNPRFAVVYHLLSTTHNWRLRVRVFVTNEPLVVASAVTIWPAANWYEREAYDLFGILFDGHPDLRRLLTDYGFVGHPFRKDFPLIGDVEMRFDATLGRVVYEPVSITPRVLVPKVIRDDSRYGGEDEAAAAEQAGDTHA